MAGMTQQELEAVAASMSGEPEITAPEDHLQRIRGRLFQAEIEYQRALTMSPAECLRLAREDILDCALLLRALGEPAGYKLPGTKAALGEKS
jgi:hypothetical protein